MIMIRTHLLLRTLPRPDEDRHRTLRKPKHFRLRILQDLNQLVNECRVGQRIRTEELEHAAHVFQLPAERTEFCACDDEAQVDSVRHMQSKSRYAVHKVALSCCTDDHALGE